MMLGIIAFQYLDIRFMPNIDLPGFFVGTNYPGASARVIESNITDRLEDALKRVSGIKTLRSKSYFGHSEVHINLKAGEKCCEKVR